MALTWTRLAALVSIIFVLAIALPYGAVTTLHKRRLRAADEGTRAIAEGLKTIIAGDIPAGTEVLAGPGDRPVVNDERWNSATSIPLARVLPGVDVAARPDPWGNAYLVNIAALKSAGTVWVLSAGPDGIVQTPFLSRNSVLADDRAAPVR
jgi:hypothetical protein